SSSSMSWAVDTTCDQPRAKRLTRSMAIIRPVRLLAPAESLERLALADGQTVDAAGADLVQDPVHLGAVHLVQVVAPYRLPTGDVLCAAGALGDELRLLLEAPRR